MMFLFYEDMSFIFVLFISLYRKYRTEDDCSGNIHLNPNEATNPTAKNWLRCILFIFYLYSLSAGTQNGIYMMNKGGWMLEIVSKILTKTLM